MNSEILKEIAHRSSIIGGLDNLTVKISFKDVREKELTFHRHNSIAFIEDRICRQYPSAISYKILESGFEGVLGDRKIMADK
jgi:hypothetical protein